MNPQGIDEDIRAERQRWDKERIAYGRQIDELVAEVLDLKKARLGWITAATQLDERLSEEQQRTSVLESRVEALTAECERLQRELKQALTVH